ncbi:DUF4238 domain-containing protein [Coleofasciculus sp. FACHB-SPT9]|uniref:DUF4238 domain-containing protein n=1 Tax=Cyanophyceae TaxID=3028117 RepID=UPI001683A67A|nr:DUF4238 domain-containing protein [Coleofasciculus sp. FACHB-SPT9]MBD1892785.1 DUF4238 domain-containing protein [Coleofasciculus sp. FACHB-SPT9]
MSKVTNQHYVPQCYLKNFTTRSKIFVFDKILKKSLSFEGTNVRNVASARYFNDFPEEMLPAEIRGTGESQLIENNFSAIEVDLCQTLGKIITAYNNQNPENINPTFFLNKETKEKLSYFLMLQIIRTRNFRNILKRMFEDADTLLNKLQKVRSDYKPLADEYVEPLPGELNNFIGIENFIANEPITNSQKQHVIYMFNKLNGGNDEEITKALAEHIWIIGVNPTAIPLCTSDNPVVINEYQNFGTGLTSVGVQIAYPISPKLIIILFEASFWKNLKSHDRKCFNLSEKWVRLYNKLQLTQCTRQVYSSTNDFSWC